MRYDMVKLRNVVMIRRTFLKTAQRIFILPPRRWCARNARLTRKFLHHSESLHSPTFRGGYALGGQVVLGVGAEGGGLMD